MPGEPTIDQGHIDAALSDFAVSRFYYSKNFIADIIAPPQPVSKRVDEFFIVDPREGLTDEHEEELIYGQPSTELNFVIGKGKYDCQLHGKKHLTPEGTDYNADPAIKDYLKGDALLINNMAIRRERALWAMITEDGLYPAGHWNPAIVAWDDAAAIPKQDIDVACRAVEMSSGAMPNTLVVPPKTYDALTGNADIKDLIKYQRGDLYLRTGGIGDVVFNLRLIRAGALYDEAAPLEASNIQFIWENATSDAGDDWALVCFVDPNPGLFTAGFLTQFVWNFNSLAPGLMGRMRVWYDDDREGEWHDFRTDYCMLMTNNRAGAMITGTSNAS